MDLSEARLRWSAAQGLDTPASDGLAATVARTGWLRTLGGAAAYLALAARNDTATVATVNAAVAAGALRVSPAVRGCIYLVPEVHAPLALRIADRLSAKRNARDLEKVGVAETEIEALGEQVLETLAETPLGTRALGRALPDGAVRKLGEVGKKVGISSTLPPTLRKLEFAGRIRRQPVDDRLDHERYTWRVEATEVAGGVDPDTARDTIELARIFFRWAGPATRKAFAAWSGLNQTEAKAAIAELGLDAIEVDALGEAFLDPASRGAEPVANGRAVPLPAMDNLLALRERAAPIVPAAQRELVVDNFGRGSIALGEVTQPLERTIAVDGVIRGLWAWDPRTDAPAVHAFDGAALDGLDAALERAGAVFAALGSSRRFCLDKDPQLVARVEFVRGLG